MADLRTVLGLLARWAMSFRSESETPGPSSGSLLVAEDTSMAEFDKLPGRFERAAGCRPGMPRKGRTHVLGGKPCLFGFVELIVDVFSFTLLTVFLGSSDLKMSSCLGRPWRLPGLTAFPGLDPFSCRDTKQACDFAISVNGHGAQLVDVTSETCPHLGVSGEPPPPFFC